MRKKVIDFKKASQALAEGGVVAYPTEAVYGLGCDPFNETAVMRLLKIKKRDVSKGLILIASDWDQIKPLVKLSKLGKRRKEILQNIHASWPGAVTWILPATKKVPKWITGKYDAVAIRISAHEVVQKLCKSYGGPIVSTSANIAGTPPIKKAKEINEQFSESLDFIIDAKVGKLKKPTIICDALTGNVVRE